MTAPSLVVAMSAREAVAAGAQFRRRGETFSDPGVALDEVLSLRASQEPLVLRVEATGGSPEERSAVEGDWFCDVGGAEPRRVRHVPWNYDRESAAWAEGMRLLEAWESCRKPMWLVAAAWASGVGAGPINSAAANVLGRTSVKLAVGWPEARRAVSLLRGSPPPGRLELDAARDEAEGLLYTAAFGESRASPAARRALALAVGNAVLGAIWRSESADGTEELLAAVGAASDVVRPCVDSLESHLGSREFAESRACDWTRDVITSAVVLRAASS